jgi:hypothetical protein
VEPGLTATATPEACVEAQEPGRWRLTLPAGGRDRYRLAQLDDYCDLPRKGFRWTPPVRLRLSARVSTAHVAGTWGFGFWNDPFSLSLGFGGGTRRFPVLPNAAWFFFAAAPNYLSFRDDVAGQGFLAQTFRSGRLSPLVLAAAGMGMPLLGWPRFARWVRPLIRRLIGDDSVGLKLAVCEWHTYQVDWQPEKVEFRVDGDLVFEASLAPREHLGLVVWIDNQYAAYPPSGKVSFGRLPCAEPVWLEVEGVRVEGL